jgi:predicted cupin superfamily sugar epimerase
VLVENRAAAGVAGGRGQSSLVYYLFEPTYTASAWVFIGERARQIMPARPMTRTGSWPTRLSS